MADDNIKKVDLTDLAGQQIPSDILDQLQVLGRVQFKPGRTSASAVSEAGDEKDQDTQVSGVLDHVGGMADLADQIEDMIDDLTADMEIPVDNDTLRDAVKALDPAGDGSTITKDVLDKARALLDHGALLVYGYDHVLAAITGNGTLEGDFLDCDQVTRSIAETWNTAEPRDFTPEEPIIDETSKIADEYEKNLAQIIIEILQTFFFNMLWPKYLVDLGIINPTRILVAYPTDSIICFFKSMKEQCNVGRFRLKKRDCLKVHGPINKLINKFRCFLLCVPPKLFWSLKKYKPMVDISDCEPCSQYGKPCPDTTGREPDVDEDDEKLSKLGNIMDAIFNDDEDQCVDIDDMIGDAKIDNATGVGVPPECLKHAGTIMNAVIADALSPSDPSKAGITGTQGGGANVTNQTIINEERDTEDA